MGLEASRAADSHRVPDHHEREEKRQDEEVRAHAFNDSDRGGYGDRESAMARGHAPSLPEKGEQGLAERLPAPPEQIHYGLYELGKEKTPECGKENGI